MNPSCALRRSALVSAAAMIGIFTSGWQRSAHGEDLPKPAATAWNLDEALQQLAFHPKDPYLQYVALQLGKREGREQEVITRIEGRGAFGNERGRRSQADLFSTFTGALAIQESLQLDTMRGERRPARNRRPDVAPRVLPPGQAPVPEKPAEKLPERVAVASLVGPTVQSHPW